MSTGTEVFGEDTSGVSELLELLAAAAWRAWEVMERAAGGTDWAADAIGDEV